MTDPTGYTNLIRNIAKRNFGVSRHQARAIVAETLAWYDEDEDDEQAEAATLAAILLVVDIAVHIISQSRGTITLDQLVEMWEQAGMHHMLLERLCLIEELEGDEYAAMLDEFEGTIIDQVEMKLAESTNNGRNTDDSTVPGATV